MQNMCYIMGDEYMENIPPISANIVRPMHGGWTENGPIIWYWTKDLSSFSIQPKDDPSRTLNINTLEVTNFANLTELDNLTRPIATRPRGYVYKIEILGLATGETLNTTITIDCNDEITHHAMELTNRPDDCACPNFSFVFGSCFDDARTGNNGAILECIANMGVDTNETQKPSFMIFGGDSTYYEGDGSTGKSSVLKEDMFSTLNMLKRQFTTRTNDGMQLISMRMPALCTWDDHDFAWNNSNIDNMNENQQKVCKEVFEASWANYDPTAEKAYSDSIAFSFRWGLTEFFFPDERSYRSENNNTILGSNQCAWLINAVDTSEAKLRIIVSASQIIPERGEYESFANNASDERDDLLKKLIEVSGDGSEIKCLILSGDVHFGEVSTYHENVKAGKRPGVLEITSSPMVANNGKGNTPSDDANNTRFFSVKKEQFCEIHISWKDKQPIVSIIYRDGTGAIAKTLKIDGFNIEERDATMAWHAGGTIDWIDL